jgi:hypothetical protein
VVLLFVALDYMLWRQKIKIGDVYIRLWIV